MLEIENVEVTGWEDTTSNINPNPVELAYKLLVSIYNTKDVNEEDLFIAIEEAIGYLGQALE